MNIPNKFIYVHKPDKISAPSSEMTSTMNLILLIYAWEMSSNSKDSWPFLVKILVKNIKMTSARNTQSIIVLITVNSCDLKIGGLNAYSKGIASEL